MNLQVGIMDGECSAYALGVEVVVDVGVEGDTGDNPQAKLLGKGPLTRPDVALE